MARDESTISPLSMLYQNEQQRPNEIYLRQPIDGQWHEFTWHQTMDQARRIANFLQQGYHHGDRIASLSKNCAEWFIMDFAIMMAGMVHVPMYATQYREDIEYILQHSGAKLIFVGKLDDWSEQEKGIPTDIERVAFPYENPMPAQLNWSEILEKFQPIEGTPLHDPNDIMTIIYTSGTTGSPKGVVYNYQRVSELLNVIDQDLKRLSIPEYNHLISYLPLAHVVERIAIELFSVCHKADVSFVQSLDTFAENLRQISPTIFFAVPRIWKLFQTGILKKLPQHKLDKLLKIPLLSSLIKLKIRKALGLNRSMYNVSGAAPIAASLIEWFDKLGITICEGYGQTENFAYTSINLHQNRKVGSVGTARAGVEFKLGENEELLVKSPGTMIEYYNEPELTEQTIGSDGFLHSGDKARIDDDGHLYIIGRVKEQFKTAKGEYVSPVPIELTFAKNDLIEQCCLVGAGLRQPILIAQLAETTRDADQSQLGRNLEHTLNEINQDLSSHDKVSHIIATSEEWTPNNNLLTPTLKLKRSNIEARYQDVVQNADQQPGSIIFHG